MTHLPNKDNIPPELNLPGAFGFTMKGWDFSSSTVRAAINEHQMLNPAFELGTNVCPWNCDFCFTESPENREFTIANTTVANVAAIGVVQIQFKTSADGSPSNASLIDSINKHLNIKLGKQRTFTVLLASDATSFIVVNLDPGTAAFANDPDPTNNVFTTPQPIVVF